MRMVDLIEKKSDGAELTAEEIRYIVDGFTKGSIPDYQMSAFMMAVVHRGMDLRETADLTYAMMHSGETVDLSSLPGIKVDKHSTGGVGDTTTLVIAPLVAACGGTVAKMSGRGLGHTGGTLDKLESIPGVTVEQPLDRFIEIVRRIGLAVIGQSGDLDPADKKMYALRDVTATVRSIPLIAASIMSKKLAAGADAIVLDVKTGSGAFCHSVEEARELAGRMVDLGSRLGRRVTAIITDMNQPLGLAVGNALEVKEAIQVLSGKTPETDPLYRVCMILGSEMLLLSSLASTKEEAEGLLKAAIADGRGLQKLREMISAMGGDASFIDLKAIDALIRVRATLELYPPVKGYVSSINAEKLGLAAQVLGAGRAQKTDAIDHAVGIWMHCRLGSAVSPETPMMTLYLNDESKLDSARLLIQEALQFSDRPVQGAPMVYDVIRG